MEVDTVGDVKAIEGDEIDEPAEEIHGVEEREEGDGFGFGPSVLDHGFQPVSGDFVAGQELEPRSSRKAAFGKGPSGVSVVVTDEAKLPAKFSEGISAIANLWRGTSRPAIICNTYASAFDEEVGSAMFGHMPRMRLHGAMVL